MPRYFFHTLHEQFVRDAEGETLPGPGAAHRGALRIMGEIIRDGQPGFLDVESFRVLCTDGEGEIVVGFKAGRLEAAEAAASLSRLK